MLSGWWRSRPTSASRRPRASRPRSPAPRRCLPKRFTALPTPATRCSCTSRSAAASGPRMQCTRSATGPSATTGPCSRRSGCSWSVERCRSGRGSARSSSPPARGLLGRRRRAAGGARARRREPRGRAPAAPLGGAAARHVDPDTGAREPRHRAHDRVLEDSVDVLGAGARTGRARVAQDDRGRMAGCGRDHLDRLPAGLRRDSVDEAKPPADHQSGRPPTVCRAVAQPPRGRSRASPRSRVSRPCTSAPARCSSRPMS